MGLASWPLDLKFREEKKIPEGENNFSREDGMF